MGESAIRGERDALCDVVHRMEGGRFPDRVLLIAADRDSCVENVLVGAQTPEPLALRRWKRACQRKGQPTAMRYRRVGRRGRTA